MQTELDGARTIAEHVESQMDMLERKISGVLEAITRLKAERAELVQERDSLAAKVSGLEEELAGVDSKAVKDKLDELREENELLRHERESIARRIGELLDKLDLLST